MKTDQSPKIDVLINVFSKPFQTALSLLSLLRHSGESIDRIYFHEEPARSEFDRRGQEALLEYLGDRVIHFLPPHWLGREAIDRQRLADEDYRLSIRYQYGWERSDKTFALIIHNDITVTADVAAAMLAGIGPATAIGEIGQCWWCPAGQRGFCSSERYTEFRPKYHQLMHIYNQDMDYTKRRAFNLGLKPEFWEKPWPLPECRVNEWCMLVNLDKARPATAPLGPAAPLGGQHVSGAKIGADWDEDVHLDTGVQWFRDMNHLGHVFADFPVEDYIIHDRRGSVALHRAEVYVQNEIAARKTIEREFPEFYRLVK